jgi:hypothetical protein
MWHPFATLDRTTPSRCRPARRRRATSPRLESLEGRVVLSASFDSVLGVGSDTHSITPSDNAVDVSGNTYVTGILQGTIDFDPAVNRPDGSDILTLRGSSDAYVVKYAADGSFAWARSMGGDYIQQSSNDYFERGSGVAVDGAGNVFVTGHFHGQADFGPVGLTSAGSSDAFVTKLDPNGNTLWARGWGGTTQDAGNDLSVDAAGNVVSVGSTAMITPSGGYSWSGSEVRKYSPTGAAVWSKRIANSGGQAQCVATDAAGNVYLGGTYTGTVDFNPDPKKTSYVTGSSDFAANGYVLKLTGAGAFGWVAPFVAKTSESPSAVSRVVAQLCATIYPKRTYAFRGLLSGTPCLA